MNLKKEKILERITKLEKEVEELKDVVKLLCEKGKISKEDGRELMSELFG